MTAGIIQIFKAPVKPVRPSLQVMMLALMSVTTAVVAAQGYPLGHDEMANLTIR
jgi:hypothetical protein